MKYNIKDYGDSGRTFFINLATSLTIPYIKNRAKFPLKSVTLPVINGILKSCHGNITVDIEWNEDIKKVPDCKCHLSLKSLHGLRDQERRPKKAYLNKRKVKCQKCKKRPRHQAKNMEDGFHCDNCVYQLIFVPDIEITVK